MDNAVYLDRLFRDWEQDPSRVDPAWDAYFRRTLQPDGRRPIATTPGTNDMAYRQSRVDSMLWAYRDIGYLYAHLNPLGKEYGPSHDYLYHPQEDTYERLSLKEFGIPKHDLDTLFSAGRIMKPSPAPLRDIITAFRQTYCGPIGVEFLHIQDKRIRRWLIEKMESTRNRPILSDVQKRIILEDLIRTDTLEHLLQQAYVGQKRFSLEGSEAIVPGLHFLVDSADRYGIRDIVIGTTHRGRLSILNTILHMTPEELFCTFDETCEGVLRGGTGDVKYHIGYETDHVHEDGSVAHISMVANSSHLESVDAVVQGKARALQDRKHARDRTRVLPILLHGDAAFSGQGVVAETLNLTRLEGYTTGGTIHIIINNQIGFTTPARHARSSLFPTDVAKALPVPIFHINGDNPESLVYAADLALQFRQTFGTDCVLDVFCYRRYGHNEADEPSFTHPYMYKLIKAHPSVATLYGRQCIEQEVLTQAEQDTLQQTHTAALKEALGRSRSKPVSLISTSQGDDWAGLSTDYAHGPLDTGVPEETLRSIADHVTTIPEGFHIHTTLGRILSRKRTALETEDKMDWSFAEALAFGSLLLEGIPVRLSGEDSVRGTFSQRHVTWWDTESERPRPYTPLSTLSDTQAELTVCDSPLSEYSILGFEYGYSLVNPHGLAAWEAQFGDFSNGAQVIIDNYIASAESKWGRSSNLVLLLPHGNEGQGPDHSSAHLARFLQLAAADNLQICNLTTPAQYFHALRRQVKAPFRKPLVILTPKSLLRHPQVVSSLADLAHSHFAAVLDDTLDPGQVERVLLCSGKVYYDLMARRTELENRTTALIRIEQLYPFPESMLRASLQKYTRATEVIWVQEEPRNWGAWFYLHEYFSLHFPHIQIQCVSRDESPSSATGLHRKHLQEQEKLMELAFAPLSARAVAAGEADPGENT